MLESEFVGRVGHQRCRLGTKCSAKFSGESSLLGVTKVALWHGHQAKLATLGSILGLHDLPDPKRAHLVEKRCTVGQSRVDAVDGSAGFDEPREEILGSELSPDVDDQPEPRNAVARTPEKDGGATFPSRNQKVTRGAGRVLGVELDEALLRHALSLFNLAATKPIRWERALGLEVSEALLEL